MLFLHYGDMLTDIETEMRRLATFCGIEVAEDRWPAIVDAVGIDRMRDDARRDGDPAAMIFDGGVARFIYKGTNGRWRDVLTEDDLALYEQAAAALDPALRTWLEGGRTAG